MQWDLKVDDELGWLWEVRKGEMIVVIKKVGEEKRREMCFM
jgi:hypothetical protein